MVTKSLDHHIRLNRDARSDIEWWFRFSAEWNGMAMIQGTRGRGIAYLRCFRSVGLWGLLRLGVVHTTMVQGMSYHGKRTGTHSHHSISMGQEMAGENNQGVMRQLSSGVHYQSGLITESGSHASGKMPGFYKAKFDLTIVASHIQGAKNTVYSISWASKQPVVIYLTL